MSGNSRSNQDLVMGRTNTAQDRTVLRGQPDDGEWNAAVGGGVGSVLEVVVDSALPMAGVGAVSGAATSGVGVLGTGRPGVLGVGRGISEHVLYGDGAIDPRGRAVGVAAHGGEKLGYGIGLQAEGLVGAVCVGHFGEPGAVLATDRGAPLRLKPWTTGLDRSRPALPDWGLPGDVLFVDAHTEGNDIPYGPSLWICVDGSSDDGKIAARWAQIGLSVPVAGTEKRPKQ